MTGPDGLLVACPSCSAWPVPVRVSPAQRVGDECRVSFKCVTCGHSEGGSLKSRSRSNSTPKRGVRRRVDGALNVKELFP
jgi:hypothetical protein